MSRELDCIFRPRSIAVLGASATQGKWGYELVKSIVEGGFQGPIYPVNPKGGEVLGLKIHTSLGEVPGPIDMAVIGLAARLVPQAVRECGAKGIRGIVVPTAGFAETGEEGKRLQQELVEVLRREGMRMVGPNCVGVINSAVNLNTTVAHLTKGTMSLLTQSGNITVDVEYLASRRNLGFSKLVSFGNQADIRFDEYLDYLRDDPDTAVVMLYVESVRDGTRFLDAAREVSRNKPIVALKSGATKSGRKAATSHTAALASSDAIYDAAFKQAGIVRVSDAHDLLDVAEAFVKAPPMKGKRVVVLTDGGGHAALACDAVDRFGLELPMLKEETQAKLRGILFSQSITWNPVDFVGAAEADLYNYVRCADVILADDDVDGLLIVGALFGGYGYMFDVKSETEVEAARGLCEIKKKHSKPVVVHCPYAVDEVPALRVLGDGGIPVYARVDSTVRCMGALAAYAAYRKTSEVIEEPEAFSPGAIEGVRSAVDRARSQGRTVLVEPEAIEVLKAYGLPVARAKFAQDAEQAVSAARAIGYPVAAKVVSPDILHKSDAGGVRLDLKTDGEVQAAFASILESSRRHKRDAQILGVLISEMKPKDTEIIVGATRDPEFGPVVMFGLGGVFVEVLEDIAFRVAPLSRRNALEMIEEIRGFPLLKGVRGERPKDIESIADVLLQVSRLACEHPELQEIDLNPIFVYEDGLAIVDARILLT